MSASPEDSERWRGALLEVSLRVYTCLAFGVSVAVYALPVPAQLLRLCLLCVMAVSGAACFLRGWSYRTRTLCLLVSLHVLLAFPLLRSAVTPPNVSAGFLLEAVLATLLLGRRAGLVATAAVGLTFALLLLRERIGLEPARPEGWQRAFDATEDDVAMRVGAVAVALGIGAVLGIAHLLSRLERAIAERDEGLVRVSREHAARLLLLQELEEREAEFVRARELEVLGRLSAYVAHDFNNALLAIFGGVELARQTDSRQARDEALHIVSSAATQAASTVRQLRAFGPQPKRDAQPVDPWQVVQSTERTLRILLPKNIELTIDALGYRRAAISVDEGLLQAALMNLALNASDAMRDGGRLEIRVRESAAETTVSEASLITIEVQDSGVGMDEATRARVFAPFFSTKGPRGTGLGLSSVRQTVEAAGGSVGVSSEVGRGTCVQLSWPVAAHASRPSSPPPSAAVSGPLRVVEDEAMPLRTAAGFSEREQT